MKWGRKKSSPPLLVTRVFPVTWFSKFKQKGSCPETSSGKKQQRGKLDLSTRNSWPSAGWREAIFYNIDDDDDYWTLSFREERAGEGRRKKGRINPLWFDSDDEFQVPKSLGLKEMRFPRGVHRSINDIVLDIETKMKEKQHGENTLRESGAFRKKQDRKFKKIKAKTESQVKSVNIGRRSHSKKMKQTDCRIRVLGDMKKGRKMLKKKERKEQAMEFNSFAVAKSSFDPQQDFRDSMVEMIKYRGIRRPEELEQLLAAYLTLNSDGYHYLIIKAFQQVWLELSKGVF